MLTLTFAPCSDDHNSESAGRRTAGDAFFAIDLMKALISSVSVEKEQWSRYRWTILPSSALPQNVGIALNNDFNTSRAFLRSSPVPSG